MQIVLLIHSLYDKSSVCSDSQLVWSEFCVAFSLMIMVLDLLLSGEMKIICTYVVTVLALWKAIL